MSAMLFRLTKESWSSHALLDAKLLLTNLACAGSTYRGAAPAAVGDCMEHIVIRQMLLCMQDGEDLYRTGIRSLCFAEPTWAVYEFKCSNC